MLSLSYIIRKLRERGLGGVLLYVKLSLQERRFNQRILANAKRYPMTPQRGVTLMLPMSGNAAINKVCRDLELTLRETSIPYQVYNVSAEMPKDFRVLKYQDIIDLFYSWTPHIPGVRTSTIAFWEFQSGFLEQCPRIVASDRVVAMSDFDHECFQNVLPRKSQSIKLLYPLRKLPAAITDCQMIRQKYGIPNDAFVVFFNFDYGSGYGRKNPEGCLRAFAQAFKEEPSVRLLFKTQRASRHPEAVEKLGGLVKSLGLQNKVISEDHFISDADLMGLTNACDAYLSLHRGEGFGLGVAEAMQLGKPVVVTDWSSTTEFCKAENSLPVKYRLISARGLIDDQPAYACVEQCAEPDIDDAARKLRFLFDNREEAHRIGVAGQQFIQEHFSKEHFIESMERFMSHE